MPQITSYPVLTTPSPDDVLVIVDTSDTSQSPSGTTKQIQVANLSSGTSGGGGVYAPLAGAEFTGFVAPAVVTLTYSTTISVSAAAGNDFRLTLTGSTGTIANPTSPEDGQTIKFWIAQDATGSRTVSWGAAFNFGGGSAPTLSTAANAVDLLGFTYNLAENLWRFIGGTVGGGGSGLGVTLSGTPAAGDAAVATSSTAAEWLGLFGTRPEAFGTITGTSGDQVALSAAITAINSGAAPGPLVLTQKYSVDSTVTLLPGVDVVCTGQGNRQVGLPDTFLGGYICPSSSFPTGSPTALLAIGSSGTPNTNPCGAKLTGLALSGLIGGTGSSYAANCIGLLVTDTADVHVTNAFLSDFDRTGATGTAIKLVSASSGNGVGFNLHHSVISGSNLGLYGDGAGISDVRCSNNLWHSCNQQVTFGATAGGGGLQMTNDHLTFSAMPSSGYHLSLGAGSGDSVITSCYFDQANNAVAVLLATDKIVMANCHWLATSTSTAVSLVKIASTVTNPAEMVFCNNSCQANGSSIQALLQTAGHSGIPNGGIWLNNVVYGTAPSLIAPLIDSASAIIPQILQPPGGTSDYLRADGTWQNPGVSGGTVSGSYACPPTSYAPASLTTPTISSATLTAWSSANINSGSFTAPASGSVVVTVNCVVSMPTANVDYSFSLATHGSTTPVCNAITCKTSSAAIQLPHTLVFPVNSLTPSASYTLDLLGAIASGTFAIQAIGTSSTTPTGTVGGPVTMIVSAV